VVTEWDIANVLYHICKDRFVCASISKNIWYEFVDHKWSENDSGNSLRLCVSSLLFEEYNSRANSIRNRVQMMEQTNPLYEKLVDVPKKLDAVATLLKKTTWKSNIMREARELFYDSHFMDKLDCNPWLLCFNNGVVDFKNKCFRKGQHDDYISKSTLRDYIPLKDLDHDVQTKTEVDKFFKELFPIESLRNYMWQHFASILIGINPNQTFNVYIGSGRNGKSCLVELMSIILGELKATIPITLVTSKRNTIGSTSSEVAQLKGIRYAVMQEPSKGDRINEGILKEITGGDPIQARALYKDTVTFVPQFTLVVCTNVLFELNSTDDGTLRRFRICDFKSKFIDNPYEDEIRFPKNICPYQYKLDKNLSSKFKRWVPLITAQLVELAFERHAKVDDCEIVMSSTDRYRESQDYLSEFVKEFIVHEEGESLKKMEVYNVFKDWYTTNYGRSVPKSKEVCDFMNMRYGHYNGSWKNIKISYDED
jgi:P4 family phage/plasmid primase-like protien